MRPKIIFTYVLLLSLALTGCSSKEETQVEDVPEDAWVALRMSLQDEGLAGFLVPLDGGKIEPDWIFRKGIYCRDGWDMKRAIADIIKDKPIITKKATSLLVKDSGVFENYDLSIEEILKTTEGKEMPPADRLPFAKAGAVFFTKIAGQISTSAGFIIPHTNAYYTVDKWLEEAVYVPNISEIHKYFPIQKFSLMVAADSPPSISQRQRDQMRKEHNLDIWTEREVQMLKKILEEHGGKPANISTQTLMYR